LLEECPSKVQFGIYSQDNLFIIIEKMMASKQIPKNITFKELYDLTKKELVITGVCVNDISVHYFSHKTHENMEILTALKITSCIPLLFKPIEYDNKLWIDGGCMDNYPVNYLEKKEEYIGIYIEYVKNSIEKIEKESQYISQLLKCIILNAQCLNQEDTKNTIVLETHFGNAFISVEKKIELYNAGYAVSVEKFLKP
jgi:predicted patatin/cPLA2 family phospholipase